MKIRAIVHTFTSERDRNGNCYHAARVTNTDTGASITIGHVGGQQNASAEVRRLLGFNHEGVYLVEEVIPIRQFQRGPGQWDYLDSEATTLAMCSLLGVNPPDACRDCGTRQARLNAAGLCYHCDRSKRG